MRIFNRIAVYALLLVLPMAGFAQATSSSQSTAVGGGMSERMSQVVGAKAMFPNGQQAGTVRDIVVGDKGDFSYLVIEFNRDALGAGTSVQGGTTTGTTQTPAGTTGTNTSQSGTTAQTQTPSGASNSATQNQSSTNNNNSSSGTSSGAMMAQSNAAYSSTQWFLGSKLKDYTLVDPQGKDLGKISDAMLDLSSHQIAYLAFGVGGFLGIGEKIVALPLTDITSWDTANHKIMVTMTSDSLKNAQGIDKKNWPSSASEAGAASNGAASGSSSGQTK